MAGLQLAFSLSRLLELEDRCSVVGLAVLQGYAQSSLLVKDLTKVMMQSHASRRSAALQSIGLTKFQSPQIGCVERSRNTAPVSNVQHQVAKNLIFLVLSKALKDHTLLRLVLGRIVEDGDGLPHSHIAVVGHGGHVVQKRRDSTSMHGSEIIENVVGDGELKGNLCVALVVVRGAHGLASVVE